MFVAAIEPEIPPPGPVVIADIYVTKTTLPVGQATVIAGNTLTYRVTAGNLGPDVATGVAIQDTLPVNTQLISTAPSAGGTCTYNATTRLVDCRWPADLPVGATVFVDITVRVCPDNQCDTILDNRASAFMLGGGVIPGGVIYGQDFASNLGDFTLNNELLGGTSADWAFNNTCTPSVTNLGQGHTPPGVMRWGTPTNCLSYGSVGSFTVGADSGFDNALSPVVQTGACVSNLRARMKYYQNTEETFFDSTQVIANNGLGDVVIASSAGAFGGQAMVVEFGDPLFITSPQWQSLDIALEPLFGNVIPQNMTFRFSADTLDTLFNYGYGSFIDDFEVVCDVSTDPDIDNNFATLLTTVQTQSTLVIQKTQDIDTPAVGEIVTYTIMGSNLGPSNSNGTVIRDTLPPNFVFISAQTTRGSCNYSTSTGIVTCNIGVLGAPANQCVTTPLPSNVTVVIRAQAVTNLSEATRECREGLVTNLVTIESANCLDDTGILEASVDTCVVPRVNPNRQLGGQVHLPILNFEGQDDVCRTWLEVQNVGAGLRQGRVGNVGRAGLLPAAVRGSAEGGVHGLAEAGQHVELPG